MDVSDTFPPPFGNIRQAATKETDSSKTSKCFQTSEFILLNLHLHVQVVSGTNQAQMGASWDGLEVLCSQLILNQSPGGCEDRSSCSNRGGTKVLVTWPELGPWRRRPGLSGWLPGCSRASSAGCSGTAPPGCCPGLRPPTGRLKQKGGALPTDFLSAPDREDG